MFFAFHGGETNKPAKLANMGWLMEVMQDTTCASRSRVHSEFSPVLVSGIRAKHDCSGPDLARKLSQLVKMEKNVMRSMELVGRERREVARQLSIWGEECDEDVSDITDKLGVLIFEIGELEDQFIDRYDQYRVTIKSIRNIEASVQPSRDRKYT